MSKKIDCSVCAGLGKRLVRKAGKIAMVSCKPCKGKGKIVVEIGSKAAKKLVKPVRTVVVERARKEGKTLSLAGKVRKQRRELVEAGAAGSCDHGVDFEDRCRDCERGIRADKKSTRVEMVSRDMENGGELRKGKLTSEQQLARDTIEERAAFFGCPGKVQSVRKGPVITLYEFAPAKTTRIKRLINLQEDLALALSAEAVMVRRIPGREVMGIEISNEAGERQNVGFRASLQSVKAAKARGMELPLNLGTDPFGEPIIDDLATMPHLLIAGSTGSGKSVSLNCIISSLLTVCSPDELEFYMIDPKGVELIHYNGIPHMKEKMVTSPHYAKDLLERLIVEMRRRLQLLTRQGVRDIKEYNERIGMVNGPVVKLPRIVCIIDELGDLMMQDRREFTRMIAEISQIARATGIHMVAATQRPSVDVLSGRIKVNFPGRMAFKVTSMTDSKVILHKKGAEGLLGRGDMLYLSPTRSTTIRIHAPWVPLTDVKAIADKLREIEAKRRAEEEQKLVAERARLDEERRQRMTEIGKVLVDKSDAGVVQEADIDISFGWNNPIPMPSVLPKK